MVERLHIWYGPEPEPEMDETGKALVPEVLTADTRVKVATVDYLIRPKDLDWFPPKTPLWGTLEEDGVTRSKGGHYSYVWEKVI